MTNVHVTTRAGVRAIETIANPMSSAAAVILTKKEGLYKKERLRMNNTCESHNTTVLLVRLLLYCPEPS